MKIIEDINSIVVYLNKNIIKDYSYKNKDNTEEILDIILKIKKIFDISFIGLYKVKVYQNKKIGIVLEIFKYDDLDIIDYTDFKINIYNNYNFLLEFEDYFLIPNKYKVIEDNFKYYIEIDDMDDNDLIILSDLYNIVFKNYNGNKKCI